MNTKESKEKIKELKLKRERLKKEFEKLAKLVFQNNKSLEEISLTGVQRGKINGIRFTREDIIKEVKESGAG